MKTLADYPVNSPASMRLYEKMRENPDYFKRGKILVLSESVDRDEARNHKLKCIAVLTDRRKNSLC